MKRALGWAFLFVCAAAIYYFAGGLFLMLLVGILHRWDSNIPLMGYWLACLVALLIRTVFATPSSSKKDKK